MIDVFTATNGKTYKLTGEVRQVRYGELFLWDTNSPYEAAGVEKWTCMDGKSSGHYRIVKEVLPPEVSLTIFVTQADLAELQRRAPTWSLEAFNKLIRVAKELE